MNLLPYDLIVYGQVTSDKLRSSDARVERIGGITYAASAAACLAARVGLLGCLPDPEPTGIIEELRERGIDCEGLNTTIDRPVTYTIDHADETIPQVTTRTGPASGDLPWPSVIPDSYRSARCALIYPVNLASAVRIAAAFKSGGTAVAVDIQHDIPSLEAGSELFDLADYIFVSQGALHDMTKEDDNDAALLRLREHTGATIILKMGPRGSVISPPSEIISVPAYLSDFRLTVGAGDAFDAVFLIRILSGDTAFDAGCKAAYFVSGVIQSSKRNPCEEANISFKLTDRIPIHISQQDAQTRVIYVAGHFHSLPLRIFIDHIAAAIENLGFKTFVPHRDVGVVDERGVTSHEAYMRDLDGLRSSHAMVAVLDSASRGGTFLEMGIAVEKNIPLLLIKTDNTLGVSNMVKRAASDMTESVKGIINPLLSVLARSIDQI